MKPLGSIHAGAPALPIAHKLAASPTFTHLFREGMTLVEETAAFLDGPGRDESKALSKMLALGYASESMRLTTRLMQLASWLLLQRAVNEGEMTQAQAAAEKHKVRLSRQEIASPPEMFEQLPGRLKQLSLRSLRLQARVLHLDRLIYGMPVKPADGSAPRVIESQIESIRAAFGARRA